MNCKRQAAVYPGDRSRGNSVSGAVNEAIGTYLRLGPVLSSYPGCNGCQSGADQGEGGGFGNGRGNSRR